MNNNTDKILFDADNNPSGVTSLALSDATLNAGDIVAIAKRIKGYPNLRSLAITGSNLRTSMMAPLAKAIAEHQALTELNLSGNRFQGIDFLREILIGGTTFYANPRINSIDLSGNKQPDDLSDDQKTDDQQSAARRSWGNFVKAAITGNTVVSIRVPEDPWNYYNELPKRPEPDFKNTLNLLSCNWDSQTKDPYYNDTWSSQVYDRQHQSTLSNLITTNMTEAKRLLDRVQNAHVITSGDIDSVNARLASIIYTGHKAIGPEKTAAALRKFFNNALQVSGLEVNTEPVKKYISLTEKRGEAAPAPVPEVVTASIVPRSYDVKEILAGLPVFDEAKMRAQIEDCIEHPSNLQNLGKTECRIAADIATAGLHVMSSMPTTEKMERAVQGFLHKFQETHVLVESVLDKDIPNPLKQADDRLLPPWPERFQNDGGGLLARFFSGGEIKTLADGAQLAGVAGNFLDQAITESDTFGQDITKQIVAVEIVSGGDVRVGSQIGQIVRLSETVSAEQRKKIETPQEASSTIIAEQKTSHLDQLQEHLESLRQTQTNIDLNLAPYTVHTSMQQKVRRKVSDLVEQHFSIIGEEVRVLKSHMETSAKSGGNNEARYNKDTEAAEQTIQNIGMLVTNMLTLFRSIDDGASELRGHITQLLPTKVLAQPTKPRAISASVAAATPVRPATTNHEFDRLAL